MRGGRGKNKCISIVFAFSSTHHKQRYIIVGIAVSENKRRIQTTRREKRLRKWRRGGKREKMWLMIKFEKKVVIVV